MAAPLSGVVANDIYGFEYDFYLEPLSGPLSVQGCYGRVDILKTANGRVIDNSNFGSTTTEMLTEKFTGHCPFFPFQIQEPAANISLNAFSFYFAPVEASGSYKIGVANPRMVKLNQAVMTI